MSRQKKGIIIILAALCLLIGIAGIIAFCNRDVPLQYEDVRSVELQLDYSPFSKYTLSNAEMNELLDALSLLEFTEDKIETVIPDGCGVDCLIITDDTNYRLGLLGKRIIYNQQYYLFDNEASKKVWQITEKIVHSHEK